MKKHTLILFLLAILLVSMTACRSTESVGQQAAKEPTEKRPLTAEEARSIALSDTGLTTADFERTEYDIDDGVPQYDIEFHSGGWEYDYEIHAENGTILSSHKEKSDRPPTEIMPTEPTLTETVSGDRLTAEEAENIALNHAGVNRSDARFDRTEYDRDDGVPEYEIEFHAEGWEYDYEIHAETGKILEHHKEPI